VLAFLFFCGALLTKKQKIMNITELEERIRAKVQTKAQYGTQLTQIRWLDRKMRSWVGGTTGYIDRDSFVDHCLQDLTLVGCRSVLMELFDKYKEKFGDEEELLDVAMFTTAVMSTTVQKEQDALRRSMGAIY